METQNLEIRKHLLEYDDVMNKQRIFFYGLRTEILKGNTKDYVLRITDEIVEGLVNDFIPEKGERDLPALRERLEQLFSAQELDWTAIEGLSQSEARALIAKAIIASYQSKEERLGAPEILRWHERVAILQVIDAAKKESYDYFEQMRFGYEDEIVSYLFRVEPQVSYQPPPDEDFFRMPETMEIGPDEQGRAMAPADAGEGVQRVLRFAAGGLDDEDESSFRR